MQFPGYVASAKSTYNCIVDPSEQPSPVTAVVITLYSPKILNVLVLVPGEPVLADICIAPTLLLLVSTAGDHGDDALDLYCIA